MQASTHWKRFKEGASIISLIDDIYGFWLVFACFITVRDNMPIHAFIVIQMKQIILYLLKFLMEIIRLNQGKGNW
mgnify:FL=1